MKNMLISMVLLLLLSCNSDDHEIVPEPIENLTRTIEYNQINNVIPNLLSLDVYYTSDLTNKKPIIVYVHGGGWSIGDKTNQLDNKIDLFKSLNYILVSVNYRLSPFPFDVSNPNRIKYPLHNIDIADALNWVYNNIDQYGGNKNKIALMGHSAGAHLVALTGTNKHFLEEVGLSLNTIKGVAVIDTKGYDIIEQVTNGTNQEMYMNAFGIEVDQNRDASPIFNVENSGSYPKFFIAKRGSSQRIEYADEFINTLQINGVSVSQVNGSIYDHAGINNAIGEANETLITDSLKQFLTDCFE